jgi:hypothetical protein
MDETVRFQNRLADLVVPEDVREEVERTLVHAHAEAKGGNVTACREALERAHRFVEEAGGKPLNAAMPLPPVEPTGAAGTDLGGLLERAGLAELEGVSVTTAAGDKIGEVAGATYGPGLSRAMLVVGIGGFLGIGEHQVALPLDAFRPGVKQLILYGYDRAALEALPAHDGSLLESPEAPLLATNPAGPSR